MTLGSDSGVMRAAGELAALFGVSTRTAKAPVRELFMVGGRNRVRTCDPLLVRQVLYR